MPETPQDISNDTDATQVKSARDDSDLNPFVTSNSITSAVGVDVLAYSQLGIGSVIKETFELVAMLGEGGMGTVFKALNKVWQEVEARDPYVAIKILKPELSANKQLVRSLYSDFDRTKTLANCPNIIKVYGFDKDGPHVYMTMEYLNGKTLGEYINNEAKNITQAWFVIEGIGNALAYAHKNNIVHRDIKPGNIFITHEGTVKVLDFGIASKINQNEGDETKFGGHELGALTVAYASPEMQRDFPPDARDDIYSFACVIYEILTGKQFFKQKTHKALPIAGLNSRQMEALNKALAFERDLRTETIHELLDKLRPTKSPLVKWIAIGAGAVAIAGLVVWKVLTPAPLPEVNPTPTTRTAIPPAENTPVPEALALAPTVVPVQESVPTLAAMPTQAPTPVPTIDPGYQTTSSDGSVQIYTSKPDYKIGESFELGFKLTEPRYVRVIDRDSNGEVTVLRPNPRQPDKILPAAKEQVFPPKGLNAPVQGPTGVSTVTIVTSAQPFPKTIEFLDEDGHVNEQVKNGPYSWTQIRYSLHQ